ncbi:histidine phosphatase family protein [bacterium]|nr:histidine phosphatase family protein [bacterium]
MKVIIVRHGETKGNANGVIYGKNNLSLTKKGRKQAELAREKLKNEKINRIICSPLKRAIETAKVINQYHHLPIKLEKRIVDIRIDKRYGGQKAEVYRKVLRKNFWRGRLGRNETSEEMVKRIKSFLVDLKKKYKKEAVLIVGHEDPIKVMKAILEGKKYNAKYYFSNHIKNCQIIKLNI